ncbi:hypothetical protein HHK36_020372 [Tetracentron sinense]|uniref:WAT1-related protein n=1 Tax=Tetracentron sinense TaxID=13715 RepID=A0A834YX10_TETSI|nr:hypothetical protein HHK36_020372 [Tetracentron sinense]
MRATTVTAVSYGIFSRRNFETDKENLSKIDSAQNYVSRILQFSSVFDDEIETPSGSDENKIQTWNSRAILRMSRLSIIFNVFRPVLAMVVVQTSYAIMNLFYEFLTESKMRPTIMVMYRYILASFTLAPFAFFLERLEGVTIRTLPGMAKLAGTGLTIGGAMLLTFYKGKEIKLWSTGVDLTNHGVTEKESNHSQVLGLFLSLATALCSASWYIIQARMSRTYPVVYSSSMLMCLMASLQGFIYSLITERNWKDWELGWNVSLLVITFSGVIVSGGLLALTTWCIRVRGPLFVSVFSPLSLIFTAIAGSLFFHEKLYVGSTLGAVVIVIGLYLALWEKHQDMKRANQLIPPDHSRELEVIQVDDLAHAATVDTSDLGSEESGAPTSAVDESAPPAVASSTWEIEEVE